MKNNRTRARARNTSSHKMNQCVQMCAARAITNVLISGRKLRPRLQRPLILSLAVLPAARITRPKREDTPRVLDETRILPATACVHFTGATFVIRGSPTLVYAGSEIYLAFSYRDLTTPRLLLLPPPLPPPERKSFSSRGALE